ncbi:MAG: aminotransferase class V-fold PLP-dependent enzyme, partial [Mycobacteriaceae bacterium]|nr:aminotransferase class V-fold PLP-dependent enzyme [Mycobacteriaceae bacterium]
MTAVLDRALSGTPHLPVASCDVPLAHVVGADLQVPLANGASCRYANFDYAASAPALVSVHEHVQRALATYASVHRGAGYPSQVSTSRYETARDTVARFVNAAPDQVAVFTRNTTDALNLLASCVPGETVVLDVEHHANF